MKKSLMENLFFFVLWCSQNFYCYFLWWNCYEKLTSTRGGGFMQSWQKLTKGEQGSILTKNWWASLNCLLNLLNFKTNLFKFNLHFISRGFSVISQISPKITKIFVYVWATSSKLVIERKIIRIVFPKSIGVIKEK